MNRRAFVAGLGAVLATPLGAEAQQARKIHTIAMIFTTAPVTEMTETGHPTARSFFAGLRRLGYLEGKNLVVERRSALGEPRRFPEIAAEVVRLNPDVIVVFSTRVALAVKAVTSTIPIVGAAFAPVEEGLAASLGRPGGNFTGVTSEPGGPAFFPKWLSLFHEAVPKASRVAFLGLTTFWKGKAGRALRETAERLRIGLILAAMDGPFGADQYVKAFHFISQARAQAVLVHNQAEHVVRRQTIIDLAAQYRLPAMYPELHFVQAGGLMSYATSRDNPAVLAGYVHRIFQGSTPADLPIEEPTDFKLVINLKTAKSLGLTIPPSLLLRADQVIE